LQAGDIQRQIIESLITDIPLGAVVMDMRVCATWTIVRSTVQTGMASTLAWRLGEGPRPHVRDAGRLIGRSLRDVARLALSERPIEAAIGMAAINSGIVQKGMAVSDLNAGILLKELARGRKTAIIGAFPFAKDVKPHASELMVFDLRPGVADYGPGDYAKLRNAEVVAVTGTVFLTHSLDLILASLNKNAYTLLVGPTTPMSPRVFELGFDALCGIQVVSFEQSILGISQGAGLKQVTGLRYVTGLKEARDEGRISD